MAFLVSPLNFLGQGKVGTWFLNVKIVKSHYNGDPIHRKCIMREPYNIHVKGEMQIQNILPTTSLT